MWTSCYDYKKGFHVWGLGQDPIIGPDICTFFRFFFETYIQVRTKSGDPATHQLLVYVWRFWEILALWDPILRDTVVGIC